MFSSCSDEKAGSINQDISTGSYKFILYDSNNIKIAEGSLKVENLQMNVISGDYKFENVVTEFEGFTAMNKGKFTGKLNQKENNLLINTNPGQADRNVFFNLDLGKSPYSGTWYYSGFRNNSKPNKIKLLRN